MGRQSYLILLIIAISAELAQTLRFRVRPDDPPPNLDPRSRLHARRYSGIPFPPYRFLPGRDPHPKSDAGHSPRSLESGNAPLWLGPERWRDMPDYLLGVDLYNHGFWWEAHEAWEGLWKAIPRSDISRRFLQGLIQAGACHLQILQRQHEGARRLRQESFDHFDAVLATLPREPAPVFMGLALQPWLTGLRASLAASLDAPTPPATDHWLALYPYLILA